MGICKDCRHWKRNEQDTVYPKKTHFGKCYSYRFRYAGDLNRFIGEEEYNMLLYWDYESYSAGLETGEDFGRLCIHFEGRHQ